MEGDTLKLVAMATFAVGFSVFTILVGRVLQSRGRVFLSHTFDTRPAVAESVQFLLNLGFYLTCLGLLLWNLGIEPTGIWIENGERIFPMPQFFYTIATRLGISIFVVSAFHTLNILILSVLNRNNTK